MKKPETKLALNMPLPKSLVDKVRGDAVKYGKAVESIGAFILEDFYSAWTDEERAGFYKRIPNKVMGRPLKTQKVVR